MAVRGPLPTTRERGGHTRLRGGGCALHDGSNSAACEVHGGVRRRARSTAACGGVRGWCGLRQRGWWPVCTGSEASDGNDPFSPNAASRSFFVLDNLIQSHLRLGFLYFPSLSLMSTVPRHQKSINRGVINNHTYYDRVRIGSALSPVSVGVS
jgi:hypothetical protein